jgi:hypothetical protein
MKKLSLSKETCRILTDNESSAMNAGTDPFNDTFKPLRDLIRAIGTGFACRILFG